MKKIIAPLSFILFFLIGYFWSIHDENNLYRIKRSQLILGTLVEIQIEDEDQEILEVSINAAFDEIKRIDSLFSTYNSGNEVSVVNKEGDTVSYIHPEVYKVIQISNDIWEKTNGAFDAGLNNLIKVWGFDSIPHKPSDKKIEEGIKRSGWNNIKLSDNNSLIKNNDVQLDFGGIAKGYAVDKAIEILKKNNVDRALINAGGEIRSFGSDWIIGIRNPEDEDKVLMKLKINNKSAATSGDYENYFFEDGKRYHHILDPKNGYPASGCRSVTIIADNCTIADAYSTGIFVMGVEKGMELIEKLEGIDGLIVDINGYLYFSSGMKEFKTDL